MDKNEMVNKVLEIIYKYGETPELMELLKELDPKRIKPDNQCPEPDNQCPELEPDPTLGPNPTLEPDNQCPELEDPEPVAEILHEEKDPEPLTKAELHKEICSFLNETYINKNHDYGDSFGDTFQDLGIISAVTRMTDKMNRIKGIAKGRTLKVQDEKLEDSVLDLANYSIMLYIELMLETLNK